MKRASFLSVFVILLFGAGCSGGNSNEEVDRSCLVLPVSGLSGQIETIAGSGANATDAVDANADGSVDDPIDALEANLDTPLDTTFGPDGFLYLIDWNGHKIRVLNGDRQVAFVAGTGVEGDACEDPNDDGSCPVTMAELNHMTDVVFDSEGRMVIAAWHNSKIKREDFTTGLMEDLCGTGNRQFNGDGGPCRQEGTDLVSFDLPSSVVYDAAGNLFIADQANQVIRRLGTDGVVETVVGSCPGENGKFGCGEARGYSGDGGPALSATLNNQIGQGTDPMGKITLDGDGNLYIADSDNNVIRKVEPGTDGILGDGGSHEEVITTLAGTGEAGFSGDGGPATKAALQSPRDVIVDEDGTLYIADTLNHCVRKVDSSGIISTVAGQCGESGFEGDGGSAAKALLNRPYGIELDCVGNLYVADTLNYRIRVVYK